MARPLRIQYEGALYHILSRGNEKKKIFLDNGDYEKFIQILATLPKRFGVIIYGYVLMPNHYHLLVETPKANIVRAIHLLNTVYAVYFNDKYERAGHLFQGRYVGFLIEKEEYLLAVSRYIHLNPVRAKIVAAGAAEDYEWSSCRDYVSWPIKHRWLNREWILSQFDSRVGSATKLYRKYIGESKGMQGNPFDNLKSGIIIGSERFLAGVRRKIGAIKDREIPNKRELNNALPLEAIIAAVADEFNVTPREIKSPGRRNNSARGVCLYLIRRLMGLTNNEIGSIFGIGYSGVSQAAWRVKKEAEKEGELKERLERIEQKIVHLGEQKNLSEE
jgi:REP element-mobilizing transposase RayT